ncbi:MAG: transglutaminase domain-containing protein [Ginsengibacter sp.]
MQTKTVLIFMCFSFLLPTIIFSQQKFDKTDYSTIDSIAETVKYKNDIYKLTNDLTKSFPEQIFKARAIFKWITDNISYDYKYYNKFYYKGKEPKTYKCKDEKDCEAKKIIWETRYINKVLRKKKAVCQGYSVLLKKMCNIAGLKSEIIPGYVRTEFYQVGSSGTLDHAWNTVWLDSAYHLLDATWAAGGCWKDGDGKLIHFQKNFNDYYWLTPSDDFARNHYPQDSRWVLLSNYTKEMFSANPYYATDILNDIKLITPSSGIINAKKGDTIRFEFQYAGAFQDLQINSNIFRNPDIWVWEYINKRKRIRKQDTLAIKKQQYIKYKREDDKYEFDYLVTDSTLYYLDILFDTRRVMRFKVNIEK